MRHLLGLIAGLAILWLLLSGHYVPLTLALGGLSCVFTVWLCHRLRLIGQEAIPVHMLASLPGYTLWLLGQIAQSNISVSWRLLVGRRAISPRVVEIQTRQHSALGEAIFANSITLTPGTVTIGLEDHRAIIHALTAAGAENLENGPMAQRVRRLEGGGR